MIGMHPRWCQYDEDGVHIRAVGFTDHVMVVLRQEPGHEPRISVEGPDDGPALTGLTVEQCQNLLALMDLGFLTETAENLVSLAGEMVNGVSDPDASPDYIRALGGSPLRRRVLEVAR
ncbi:hypothetical protein AB0C69_28485 [Actinomadura sp. NPDC048032]|uniref:hypothetical protein n=1 Tax=Actinomadura sp. NPDC048032 TaxID=3155747 RepID=UPI003410ADD0